MNNKKLAAGVIAVLVVVCGFPASATEPSRISINDVARFTQQYCSSLGPHRSLAERTRSVMRRQLLQLRTDSASRWAALPPDVQHSANAIIAYGRRGCPE